MSTITKLLYNSATSRPQQSLAYIQPTKVQISLCIREIWPGLSRLLSRVCSIQVFCRPKNVPCKYKGWPGCSLFAYTLRSCLCYTVPHKTLVKAILINNPLKQYTHVSNYSNEPGHSIFYNILCALSDDSDQPAHMRRLIRVFAVRLTRLWVLGYPLDALRRLWSDCADAQADLSLRWAHIHSWRSTVALLKFDAAKYSESLRKGHYWITKKEACI